MTTERVQPTQEEIDSYQIMETINLSQYRGWIIINNTFGFIFNRSTHVFIMCDKRLPVAQLGKAPHTNGKAEIGVLPQTFTKNTTILLGEDNRLALRRSLDGRPRTIELLSTEEISYRTTELDTDGLIQRLTESLGR